ncbi:ABC transporter permease [Ruoffia tabacinasalis]|uniref:ABC transporter permease n=1 Tax=Ruoffia tabacinasalis TaxID=87458 RepID=A0A5R9EMN6_9LACT|nr:ABC transporter permease [Ruoffia tabacinasalis]TLQ48918.1 ABC transporter permease [Ruoffia tabacinasalis]
MNRLGVIIKEVYRKNVLSWSFFWMIVSPIIMVGVVLAIGYFVGSSQLDSSVGNIAVIDANAEVQEIIEEVNTGNQIQYDFDRSQADEALQTDDIDGYLIFGDDVSNPMYYRKTTSKDISLAPFEEALSQYNFVNSAEEMGLTGEQLTQIQDTAVSINSINVSRNEAGEVVEQSAQDPVMFVRIGIAYAVSIIVFIFIMNYVSIISQEIAVEKGSRIMEIILSSVSPTAHFLGKLIGILLVILTQVVIYIGLYFLISFVLRQLNLLDSFEGLNIGELLQGSSNVVILGIVYAISGILIYTVLAGFLGSLVSKTEDVNKMITPIIFLALGGFYVGMFALNSTNNSLVRITSQIPLFTPFIMPFRVAAETVSSTEITISIVVSVLFMAFVLWFSLLFYKSNVLIYSDKGMVNAFKRSFALWKSERASK